MNVLSSPIVPIQSPGELRPDTAERLQRVRTREDARGQSDEAAIGVFERRSSNNEGISRPVVNSSEVREVFSRRQERQAADEQLSLNTRKALKTFADNTPSPEQQFGIELARIDILV